MKQIYLFYAAKIRTFSDSAILLVKFLGFFDILLIFIKSNIPETPPNSNNPTIIPPDCICQGRFPLA